MRAKNENREARKFLAGAFLLPYAGTISVETPDISGQHAIVHFILFLLCLYFGFFGKPKESATKK
jgi:hypothetical protein